MTDKKKSHLQNGIRISDVGELFFIVSKEQCIVSSRGSFDRLAVSLK